MCGICGYAGFERDEHLLWRMTQVISRTADLSDAAGYTWTPARLSTVSET